MKVRRQPLPGIERGGTRYKTFTEQALFRHGGYALILLWHDVEADDE